MCLSLQLSPSVFSLSLPVYVCLSIAVSVLSLSPSLCLSLYSCLRLSVFPLSPCCLSLSSCLRHLSVQSFRLPLSPSLYIFLSSCLIRLFFLSLSPKHYNIIPKCGCRCTRSLVLKQEQSRTPWQNQRATLLNVPPPPPPAPPQSPRLVQSLSTRTPQPGPHCLPPLFVVVGCCFLFVCCFCLREWVKTECRHSTRLIVIMARPVSQTRPTSN